MNELQSVLAARAPALELFPDMKDSQGEWQQSDFKFSRFIEPYPGLRAAKGHRFLVYYERQGGEQRTRVYAQSIRAESYVAAREGEPNPDKIRASFLQGVEREDGHQALLAAALFSQEAPELGARGLDRTWLEHEVLYESPKEEWKWLEPPPVRWFEVLAEASGVRVILYSKVRSYLFCHHFDFQGQDCSCRVEDRVIGRRLEPERRT